MTTPLAPKAFIDAAAERGITQDDIDAAADALARKAATDRIPAATRRQALSVARSISAQISSDLSRHGDIPPEYVQSNARTFSGGLPRWPLDLQAAAEEVARLTDARNFGDAELLCRWLTYACEALSNPDAADPVAFEEWRRDGIPTEAAELARVQAADAEKTAAANAATRANVAWTDLTAFEQERAGAGHKPGDVVGIAPGKYVEIPQPLEDLLAGFEGGDTELGHIPGLDP